MITTLNSKTETTIKLPFAFIFYSLIAFTISQWILFYQSNSVASGLFRTPEIWMAAHFLLLGWAVMVVMGAMYQLVPVVFLTPIWNETFGFIQFVVTALGITAFAFLIGHSPSQAVHTGGVAVLGILMFLFQMFMTIKQQKEKNVLTWFVLTALSCLLLTIIGGLILAWQFAFGFIVDHQSVLLSHILFGVAGWFTLLIFGFSYKMVPMFSLAHGFSMKWAKKAFSSYLFGLISLMLSFWLELDVLNLVGWLLLWLGFTLFGLDMKEIIKKRIKKRLDRPFMFSILAIFFGWLIHGIAFVSIFFTVTNSFWSILIYSYIMMWIIFSILGYLYKIVPFLWWTHKYSKQVGKDNIPLLKDMMNEKVAVFLFISLIISVLGVITSITIQNVSLLQLFQGILFCISLLYSLTIVRVITK